MPASSAPPPPPASNGKYIVVAVLLLAAVGGLAFWKFRPQPPITGPGPGTITTIVQGAPPRRDDDLPPPPDPVATTTATAPKSSAAPGVAGTSAPSGCSPSCRGSAGDDLQSALALRGRQARKCYERELANNPKLQVHMTVSVTVGTNGSTCSANVTSSDNPGVASCVANFYRNGGFPPARGGCATVNVPLNFVTR